LAGQKCENPQKRPRRATLRGFSDQVLFDIQVYITRHKQQVRSKPLTTSAASARIRNNHNITFSLDLDPRVFKKVKR